MNAGTETKRLLHVISHVKFYVQLHAGDETKICLQQLINYFN